MSAGIVIHNRVSADSVSIESQNIQIESIHKEGTGKPVEVYYAHNVRTVGLHNSGRLLLWLLESSKLFVHSGIQTVKPRSDRRQVQDITIDLLVL